MRRFVGQTAIITGGASGIGIARRLGQEGANLAIVDYDKNNLKNSLMVFKQEGIQSLGFECNVGNFEQVSSTVKEIMKNYGKIDVLVQAAGITGKTNIKTHETEVNMFSDVMKVNANGIFYFCREVIPHMLATNYGRIVNIASVAGKEGNAGMLAYSSSKAAVIGLTKVIGKEYAETGITCNAVAPAVIQTPMVDALPPQQVKYMTDKIPMKRTGLISEIASLVAFVASKECSFTTGFCFDATGGRSVY